MVILPMEALDAATRQLLAEKRELRRLAAAPVQELPDDSDRVPRDTRTRRAGLRLEAEDTLPHA